jgi:hypothetical protein
MKISTNITSTYERKLEELDLLKIQITRMQDYIDRTKDLFLSQYVYTIEDYQTARQAVDLYDKEWFDSLLFSSEVKTTIAQELIQRCLRYLNVLDIQPYWINLTQV